MVETVTPKSNGVHPQGRKPLLFRITVSTLEAAKAGGGVQQKWGHPPPKVQPFANDPLVFSAC